MLSQNDALKTREEVVLQILLLCQVGVGTVANFLLFVKNFSPVLNHSQLRPIHVILANLAVACALILFLLGFLKIMSVFVPRQPPSDLTCKLVYFLFLVVRGTNLCSTCVLSTYQFVTVVPGNWVREILRERSPKMVSYSCYSCWLFSVINNVYIPMKVTGPQKKVNDSDSKSKWVCSTSGFRIGMGFLRFAYDIIFISIMVWTSVSMVILLKRHHQRLQHIHTSSLDNRGNAETRASHTILMVVVTFVSFYLLDCICTFLHISFVDSLLWLREVKEVLAASFPTISPLLLIFRNPKDSCFMLSRC
ncbi:vomeronasal type-1 receptor 4-like [Meriones unguiculatus]|uniref:vomeronasal type-1 receptor 4-like n=1 Tax=Meriones unguiculatus TaxID=10047 RepID=UPI00293F66E0|nr:vomeronasal type-1 receptor 4-like [Meriones unguiculatus]